jgi:hypothetical protein
MTKNTAIRLAVAALRKEIKDKSWDANHAINSYGARCKIYVKDREEAIILLEGMKDEKER